jgi:hypothetical protein
MESCGCEKNCSTRFTETTLKHIRESLKKVVTDKEKYLYFSGLIYKENKDKLDKCQRKTEFQFHVRVNNYHEPVCQKAFENVHGLKHRDIRKLLKKLKNNVICPDPEDESIEQVKEKSNARNTSAKKEAEKHIKLMLMKADVSIVAERFQ